MNFSAFTRRQFLCASSAAAFSSLVPNISLASNKTGIKLHGISAFGDLKYPPDYKHFDDANPEAPKGGKFIFQPSNWGYNQNVQTFNTLNTFVLRGDAPPRMEMCYDSLMGGSPDEPSSLYCTLSSSIEISEDYNTFTFELRPEARFHDGSSVTAEDVAFSFNILKDKGHPSFSQTLGEMISATALDDQTFELKFSGKQSDRAILSAVGVPILSKAYHQDHPIDASTLKAPLSSGQWRVSDLEAGRFMEYERVTDYWAKDMPFAIGFSHFDTLRIEFYRDRVAPFEAFKKGDILWRQEFTSKTWATQYNFPAIKDGKVKQKAFPSEKQAIMQAWAVNSRRSKFSDVRTREAIGLCFDFEWTNKNQFYGLYQRSESVFENSEFKAEGLPGADELALLEPYRAELPESVFGEAQIPPVTNGSGNNRAQLRQASRLLKEAGWKKDGKYLVNDEGERLSAEFLIRAPVFERVLSNFIQNLKRVGIAASIKLVDGAQYQSRLETFDFDITMFAARHSANPTAEALDLFFGSDNADLEGGRNYPAIRSKVLDGLVKEATNVENRKELVTVLRCIDRVLRPMHLWIPTWNSANHLVAYWDMFGFKEPKPDYAFSPETLWWYDEEKAKAIGKA